jgi:hypothetical protein
MNNQNHQGTIILGISRELRMTLLAQTFSSIRVGTPGTDPWDALEFDRWAASDPAVTSGSLAAARFLLHVWNDQTDWQCGRFSLRESHGTWDENHWAAMLKYLDAPVFP